MRREKGAAPVNTRVNPQMLQWAREEAGYTVDQAAQYLKTDPARYAQWEADGNEVPWGRLQDLGRLYKRQVATFLLSHIPPATKRPNDCRNLRLSRSSISTATLLAIRRTGKYLKLASDLMGENYWGARYAWLKEFEIKDGGGPGMSIPDGPFLESLRDKMGVPLQAQMAFGSPAEAFKGWRNHLEGILAIFVFQFPLPFDELQAFCYGERPPLAIVLNSNHSWSGRIFFLFHELAHVLRRQSGICSPGNLDENQGIERECNQFAARLLVPDDSVPLVKDLRDLSSHARKFGVSREVILRRSFEGNHISQGRLLALLNEIRELPVPERRGGFVPPIQKSRGSRGNLFYDLIVQAVHANTISFNTASDALGLSLKYI
jgi:Zn-dependent peptidase ImmA (M78 family)/transcriptional regulator with XRE-family HTH domain